MANAAKSFTKLCLRLDDRGSLRTASVTAFVASLYLAPLDRRGESTSKRLLATRGLAVSSLRAHSSSHSLKFRPRLKDAAGFRTIMATSCMAGLCLTVELLHYRGEYTGQLPSEGLLDPCGELTTQLLHPRGWILPWWWSRRIVVATALPAQLRFRESITRELRWGCLSPILAHHSAIRQLEQTAAEVLVHSRYASAVCGYDS